MKYNRAQQDGKLIKKQLLREAIRRLHNVKEANFEKEAMATYNGQRDLAETINLKRISPKPSQRIQKIANEICDHFRSFLSKAVDSRQGGDSKKHMIVPVLREDQPHEDAWSVPNYPIEQIGGELKHTRPPKSSTSKVERFDQIKYKDLNLEEEQPKVDLKGLVPQSCIYYRYGYVRTILPADENSEEYRIATAGIQQLQDALLQSGVDFDCLQFIQFMQDLKIALMPGFNFADVSGKSVEAFVEQEAREATARKQQGAPAPGDDAILSLYQYQKDFYTQNQTQQRGKGRPVEAYGIGNRSHFFLYDGSPPNGQDVVAPQIAGIKNERTLSRMIEAKIKCGYELDQQGLADTVYRYIYAAAKKQESAQIAGNEGETLTKRVTLHSLKALARQWNSQFDHMVDIYEQIEANVERQEVSKFAANQENVIGEGLEWQGGSKYQRLATTMQWNYIHFQMILQNITIKNVMLERYGPKIQVGKYQFFDPSAKLHFYCDGISQRTGLATKAGQKAPILPPFKKEKELLADDKKSYSAKMTQHGVNLGWAHLSYNGTGIWNLLHSPFAEKAVKALKVMQSPEFRQQFQDPNDPAQIILQKYPTAYLGSESLARMLYDISQQPNPQDIFAEQLGKVKQSGRQSDERKPLDAFDPAAFPLLQKYAYPLAKMMEIIYGLVHASDEATFDYMTNAGGPTTPFVMYGQSYATSSGIGGGGELLLSVRYAYKAKLDEYAGHQEAAIKIVKDEYAKRGHANRIPAWMTPASETQWPQKSNIDPGLATQEGSPLGQPKPGCAFVSNFEFFVGQSSRNPDKAVNRSMFNTVYAGYHWQDCVAQLRRLYSDGKLTIDEASGDFIWDLNADMDHLENSIHIALDKARKRIANIPITITNRNHDIEYIPEDAEPVGALLDPQAEEVGQKADDQSLAVKTKSNVEEVPTDQTDSAAQPVEIGRSVADAFPDLEALLDTDASTVPTKTLSMAFKRYTHKSKKVLDRHVQSQIIDFMIDKYTQIYGGSPQAEAKARQVINESYAWAVQNPKNKENPVLIMQSFLNEIADAETVKNDQPTKPVTPTEQLSTSPSDPSMTQPQAPGTTTIPAPSNPANAGEQVKIEKPQKSMFKRYNPATKKQLLHSSLQERVVKLANKFDSKGFKNLADKLDALLTHLIRMD